ncbi:MAG: alpha/beta hydrolase [Verrucomicrobiae bacterium]|nr:alpha/beta hydrolase [Verrucomicrobiae bacterium]
MNRESFRSLIVGLVWVVGIFGGLIWLLSVVTGRSPTGDGSERVVYRSVGGHELALWIFKPSDWRKEDHRPAVLWFFGGGFEVGIPSQFAKHAEAMAENGLVAMTVDYRVRSRHGSEVTPFDALDDARAAVGWVRTHAKELGIDPERIAAAGGSSGGHLAAMCAIPGAWEGRVPIDAPNALLLLNPAVDLDIPIVRERTDEKELASLMAISPLRQLSDPLPPTLILHGTEDVIVPLASSEAFLEKALQLGSESVVLRTFPEQGHEFYLHGFDGNRGFNAALEEIVDFLARLGWITPSS